MRYLVICLLACGGVQHVRAPADGAIAGLARDRDSGDPIRNAEIRVRAQGELTARLVLSDRDGAFDLAHLPPGSYSLTARFAGQPIDIDHIDVHAGEPTVVDVVFTLGRPDPIQIDWGTPKAAEIERYKPARHPDSGLIEGTVNEAGSHERVAGAVVTVIGPGAGPDVPTLQAVSDDQGRFRFDPVPPGTYVVSAYYSIGGRGQMEVRRSDIRVAATEGVVVPLWVEIAKRD